MASNTTPTKVVTYQALNGAPTKIKSKLATKNELRDVDENVGDLFRSDEAIRKDITALQGDVSTLKSDVQEGGSMPEPSDWFYISVNRSNGTVKVTRNPYSMTPNLWTEEPPEKYSRQKILVRNAETGDNTFHQIQGTVISVEPERSFVLAFDIGTEIFGGTSGTPGLVLVRICKDGTTAASIINLADGLDILLGQDTSAKVTAGEITLKKGTAYVQLKGESTGDAIHIVQQDAKVDLQSAATFIRQGNTVFEVSGGNIRAISVWQDQKFDFTFKPDGIWILHSDIDAMQARKLRLDKLAAAGFFDW